MSLTPQPRNRGGGGGTAAPSPPSVTMLMMISVVLMLSSSLSCVNGASRQSSQNFTAINTLRASVAGSCSTKSLQVADLSDNFLSMPAPDDTAVLLPQKSELTKDDITDPLIIVCMIFSILAVIALFIAFFMFPMCCSSCYRNCCGAMFCGCCCSDRKRVAPIQDIRRRKKNAILTHSITAICVLGVASLTAIAFAAKNSWTVDDIYCSTRIRSLEYAEHATATATDGEFFEYKKALQKLDDDLFVMYEKENVDQVLAPLQKTVAKIAEIDFKGETTTNNKALEHLSEAVALFQVAPLQRRSASNPQIAAIGGSTSTRKDDDDVWFGFEFLDDFGPWLDWGWIVLLCVSVVGTFGCFAAIATLVVLWRHMKNNTEPNLKQTATWMAALWGWFSVTGPLYILAGLFMLLCISMQDDGCDNATINPYKTLFSFMVPVDLVDAHHDACIEGNGDLVNSLSGNSINKIRELVSVAAESARTSLQEAAAAAGATGHGANHLDDDDVMAALTLELSENIKAVEKHLTITSSLPSSLNVVDCRRRRDDGSIGSRDTETESDKERACDWFIYEYIWVACSWCVLGLSSIQAWILTYKVFHYFKDRLGQPSDRPLKPAMMSDTPLTSSPSTMMAVAKKGDEKTLKQLLSKDSGAVKENKISDQAGNTLLHSAAFSGNVDLVESLLRDGTPVNKTNKYGYTALAVAVAQGHVPVVNSLISYGADPSVHDEFGETCLHTAARAGNLELVEAICQIQQAPAFADEDGCLPADVAKSAGHRQVHGYLEPRTPLNRSPPSNSQNL